MSKVQSYDSRADRWVFAPEDDPDGPLSYHGAAAVGYKIYIIGGFDGEGYFNTCRVYDTLNRSWQEVSNAARATFENINELLIDFTDAFQTMLRVGCRAKWINLCNGWFQWRNATKFR